MRHGINTVRTITFLRAALALGCDETIRRGGLAVFRGPEVAVGRGFARTELRFDHSHRLISASVVVLDADALTSLPATASRIELTHFAEHDSGQLVNRSLSDMRKETSP